MAQMCCNSPVLPTALSWMVAAGKIHDYRADLAHDDAGNARISVISAAFGSAAKVLRIQVRMGF